MITAAITNKNQSHAARMALAAISAFCVYTCMYAYRKPFTAADYNITNFFGVDYKIWLVVAQTLGYMFSKFAGIKFISELGSKNRFAFILILISIAWLALLMFAIIPAPYNIIFLFINGLPLGLIYGLVFSYLEGRKSTEILGAVLTASFIFASGFTQSIGKYVQLSLNVNVWWMPFVTGAIFFIPLLFFTWLLHKTPPPDEADIASRTERKSMNKSERKKFIRTFLSGLVLLIITYLLLTIVRDYRSNFASNIWAELGLGNDASVFTSSELLPSIVVLAIMSFLIFIKSNIKALLINHLLILAGLILAALSTIMFSYQIINGFWWMTLTGTGLYMGYVPFNCMLFERLIASFKYISTAGFIIYVADAFGYLGSCLVLFLKNFYSMAISWTQYFSVMILIVSAIGIVSTIFSFIYFNKKYNQQKINR